MSPAAEPALRLPYPGLRSFQRDESDLFFGREGTVNDMINRLRPNHFLAILGTSGSGKSSLVRIGLLDGLELGLLAEAGSRWRIADFAPGANPMRNLARELVRLSGGSESDVDFLEAFLQRGPRSLIEWCNDGHLPTGANLLLLVDQFEELFRYQDYAERQAAEAFVALLIESARNRDVPIYVVITMRSEYLGACALIEGLAEIINDGQFLTPRLNRDQCREAIVGPAAVCGTVIEPDLVNRLPNDLEDFAPWDDRDSGDQLDRLVRRADQLPLLQHTLNRLWLRADAQRADKNQPIVLKLADYDAIGGLRGAINAHADEILAKLGPAQQKRAEQVFRALTDGKSIATAVRRPTRFDELAAICDGDEAGVRAVVDAFRETGVNFLRSDTSEPLGPGTIVDISHESLIRQWRKLSGWLVDEAREAQEWTRLGEASARYRAGEGSLYYGQDLHQWRDHARPTAVWAKRYNQPYEETLAFLDQSIRADRRGRRVRTAAIAAAFIVIVGFGGFGGLIWYLVGLNNDLTTQTAALSEATAALETKNEELSRAQGELADSLERLQAAQQALRNVFLGSFDSSVSAYQQGGRWADAGALLGAMLSHTSHGTGAERSYDPAVLSAARMRLAGQWAFPVWPASDPDALVPEQAGGLKPAGRFVLGWSNDAGGIRLVDRLTGGVIAETAVAEGSGPDAEAPHAVTPDGASAIFVTPSGSVMRLVADTGQMIDYGPLNEKGGAVRALAYDPRTGRVAVVLYAEDSEVVVLAGDPPEQVFRSLLSGMDGMEDDDDPENETFDGNGIAFWGDRLVVSFDTGSGVRRFAIVDMDEEAATLLPATMASALPSPDGALLFVVESPDPADDSQAKLLVAADGTLIDDRGSPAGSGSESGPLTLGVMNEPDADVDVLGSLRAADASAAGPGMRLVEVLPLAAGGSTGDYRVILDDTATGEPDESRYLAVDLVSDGGTLSAIAAAPAAARGAPMIVGAGSTGPRFASASPVEAWGALPAMAPAKSIAWFDSVSERTVRIAEVMGTSGDGWPALSVGPAATPWPEDKLGPFNGIGVARAGDALLVVSGRHGGIQTVGEGTSDLLLREMTFGRECRFAPGEEIDLVRLVPWTTRTPLFLGLDAGGHVLRFAAVWGGRSPAATGSGPGVMVSCIGRIRPDPNAVALADPAGERVLLQTDPQTFAVLPISVESEKEFNEAANISLSAPSALAAFVPGETPVLASVDRSGHLTVLRSDPDWRVVSEMRTAVVPSPTGLAASGSRLLLVGGNGQAVVVDLSADGLLPVAAGRVPYSPAGYRLLADGRTVEALVAGAIWRTELGALPALDELGRFAEAAAGALTDSSDQDQVAVGAGLVGGEDAAPAGDVAEIALGSDALCYLAANGVIEAWKAEAGQGTPGARLTAAREEAANRCVGDGPLAVMGRQLAATPHYVSPALDPWPEEWSALLHNAIAGNRVASRATLVGLSNSADAFAGAAGEWLANSDAAFGLEVPEGVLEDAARGAAIDSALQEIAEDQRESYEPAIHELLGHVAARSGDPARLREAWVQFRIAELLYRHQIGRGAEADRTAGLRATLARALPAGALLESWNEANRWTADIAALPMGEPPPAGKSLKDRIRADAEQLAELEANGDGDAPYHLLEAYLWLNLVEIETAEAPADAAATYARFADVLTALPPVSELSPSLVAALSEVSLTLAERAVDASAAMPEAASALTPFFLGLAEPDTDAPLWDAASLAIYAQTIDAVTALIAADPEAISPEVLERLRFAERRFDHAFRLDDEETRLAGAAALQARLKLLNLLIRRDPQRWDWPAAKGVTEFWIGYRVHDSDLGERERWLSAAIRDLSTAHDVAGGTFPAENLYWLTEARRWLPTGENDPEYLALTLGGIEDYATLREDFESENWVGPLDRGELLASNAELLAKIADAEAAMLFDRSDDWSLGDPAVQEQMLDGFYVISEWDRIRRLAADAGSTWASTESGYANAPGYLPGVVGGRLHVGKDGASADECDRIASFPADPLRRATATGIDDVDLDSALPTCRALWTEDEEDPRLNFLLGRLLWLTEDRNDLGLDLLEAAADAGYAAAFNTLAGYLETPGIEVPDGDAMHLDLRFAFAQRAVLAAFDDLYAYLAPLVLTAKHRAGLRWLAERAAALGSPEAHIAVAGFPDTSPEDRAYHLEVAALLVEDEDEARAEEIRAEIPPDDYVDAADRAEDEWRVEALVGLPDGLIDALKGATN